MSENKVPSWMFNRAEYERVCYEAQRELNAEIARRMEGLFRAEIIYGPPKRVVPERIIRWRGERGVFIA